MPGQACINTNALIGGLTAKSLVVMLEGAFEMQYSPLVIDTADGVLDVTLMMLRWWPPISQLALIMWRATAWLREKTRLWHLRSCNDRNFSGFTSRAIVALADADTCVIHKAIESSRGAPKQLPQSFCVDPDRQRRRRTQCSPHPVCPESLLSSMSSCDNARSSSRSRSFNRTLKPDSASASARLCRSREVRRSQLLWGAWKR